MHNIFETRVYLKEILRKLGLGPMPMPRLCALDHSRLIVFYSDCRLTVCSKIVDPAANDPLVVVIGGIARGKVS